MAAVSHGFIPLKAFGGFVYRVLDSQGVVVYVGRTKNLCNRMAQHHAAKADWWRLAYTIEFEEFLTAHEAASEERRLIYQLQPEGNIVGKKKDPIKKVVEAWSSAGSDQLGKMRAQYFFGDAPK